MGLDICARILLVVVNICFFLVGLVFTAVGVILKWVPSIYQDKLQSFASKIPGLSSNALLTGVTESSNNATVFDLGSMISTVAIVFLLFGLLVLAISLVGLIGACCKVKILLIVYCICVLVLMAGKLAVVVIYATGYFNTQIRTELNNTIVNSYAGIEDFGPVSLSWNFFMQQFQCCGLDNYQDFYYAPNWNRNKTLTYSSVSFTQQLTTPVACCKTNGTFPSTSIVDTNCTFAPTDTNNNWNTGCWGEFDNIVTKYKIYVLIAFGIVCGFELACAILGFIIVCRDDKMLV